MMTQWVYAFGGGTADGDAGMRNLLGGKGANLAEMAKLGLPVPPGFTITTEVCTAFYANGRKYPPELEAHVREAMAALEAKAGKRFGDPADPLLVSVRSGARASMPGMMDSVLNLGLNDATAEGLATLSGDARFAYDSYRRFIQMYSDVVLGVGHEHFEEILETTKEDNDYKFDTELTAQDWKGVVAAYKAAVEKTLGRPFPTDPYQQLWGAISAVFESWQSERAKVYRRAHDIPESWGTAVNVQAMVFGNMGETSATGVAFTRNPSTGEKRYYGEYLINAQGEDVVAGIRTPKPITKQTREEMKEAGLSLEEALPDVYRDLAGVFEKLEAHYRDMQDIEFTVERGTLYILQTRSGKRTAKAALKIAVDLAQEGVISRHEAVMRVDAAQMEQLLHFVIDPNFERDVICTGLPASPGAAVGRVTFDVDEAERLGKAGVSVILVRNETTPKDINGMRAAKGLLTARGGQTSHAAVVARMWGLPCVCGASAIRIDEKAKAFSANGRTIREGDVISIDGAAGEVIAGEAQLVQPELAGDYETLMGWADAVRRLKVRANAETPSDVRAAKEFGAEGVGLCRTEHMFFDPERIAAVREMILADSQEGRVAALAKILPFQRADFLEIFRIMGDLPVTIRFLDPPLHEFLPHSEEECEDVAKATGVDAKALFARAQELQETNPMLGFRGCRLAIVYPEIYEMQARAVFEAAAQLGKETGAAPAPEIMIPFVVTAKELQALRARVEAVARDVQAETGVALVYQIGTMIELPRAALRAGVIGQHADFFSFGTNDLTQSTIGLSRDDSGKFLGAYVDKGIFEKDPFVTLDEDGVGEMVKIAAERGRGARPGLKLGICGEHGGDPASVRFCEAIGLDYVSCSPFRVPIARLAAAQAALAKNMA
jgi:pyruvate,orthophosphate dikinase